MKITDCKQIKQLLNPLRMNNLCNFKSVKGFSIDSRTIKKGECYIALKGQHHDGHKYIKAAVKKGASCIISERNVKNINTPVFIVKSSYKALEKVVQFVRKKKNPFVYAITGSVGKTTTKEMLYYLLKGDFKVKCNAKTENNILGVAKTILSLKDEDVLVLELGTNAPGEIKTLGQMSLPDVGIITFVKPVHLEGLKSIKGIAKEKTSLLKTNKKMKAVINGDDPYLKQVKKSKNVFRFGQDKHNDLYAKVIAWGSKKTAFKLQDKFSLTIKSPFEGFVYNALAATMAARILKVPLPELIRRLNRFKSFPAQRMSINSCKKYTVLNDAYNANPYSVEQALKLTSRYKMPKIAVLGDMLELGKKTVFYHKQLAYLVKAAGFDHVFTLGKYSRHISQRLKQIGFSCAKHCLTHQEIAKSIKKITAKSSKRWLIFLKGSRKMELEKIERILIK